MIILCRDTVKVARPYDVVMERGFSPVPGELPLEVTDPCKVCVVTDENRTGFSTRQFPVRSRQAVSMYIRSHSRRARGRRTSRISKLNFADNDHEKRYHDRARRRVIGDLIGFAAASYLRGIDFIQIPTTLLAAVDASVGGKTAINLAAERTSPALFHQPSLVIYDPETAEHLTHEIFLDGLAEAAKSGVIADKDLFDYIMIADEPPVNLSRLVDSSIRVKASLVEQDEKDTGMRQPELRTHIGARYRAPEQF